MGGNAFFWDVFQYRGALSPDLDVIKDFALPVLFDRIDIAERPFPAETEIDHIAFVITRNDLRFLFPFKEAHSL